jgi:hypothetical protein
MRALEYVLPQLPSIVPMLVVFLVGAVLALVELKPLGTPAALCLSGCVVLFLVTLVFPFVQGYVVTQDVGVSAIGAWMTMIGFVRSAINVAGLSLILAAVFVGRKAPTPLDDVQ